MLFRGEDPMDMGRLLREMREQRGLSLEQIAQSTKIDGREGRASGIPGEPVTARITRANYGDVLRPASQGASLPHSELSPARGRA
jgi:transcriptional regulator with XRE-family HTH domain